MGRREIEDRHGMSPVRRPDLLPGIVKCSRHADRKPMDRDGRAARKIGRCRPDRHVTWGPDGINLVRRLAPVPGVICLHRRLRLNWSAWSGNWMKCCGA